MSDTRISDPSDTKRGYTKSELRTHAAKLGIATATGNTAAVKTATELAADIARETKTTVVIKGDEPQ